MVLDGVTKFSIMENKILIDCDGVLTDGKIWVNRHGQITKGFHTHDVAAIRELISHGFEVCIVSASTWPGIDSFCAKTGASFINERNKSALSFKDYIAIGDSRWDIEFLKKATRKFCPNTAVRAVKNIEGIVVLDVAGGEGCIEEMLNYLL